MAYQLSASQLAVVNIALSVAKQLKAPYNAQVALIYAGMGESNLGDDPGTYSGAGGANGVWQAEPGDYDSGRDTTGMARAFLTGGKDFQAGGAIVCANRGDPPWKIANEVEANAVYNNTGGDSYAGRVSVSDAEAIVAQHGGAAATLARGGTAGLGSTGTSASSDNLYQFTIGQTGNPNEDYWTGINRLASEVQWYLFSDAEFLYYMDGADLICQTPAAHVDRIADAASIQHLSFTYDNTAYDYASTHRRKAKVQHKARLAKVTSPTEGQMDIICPIDFFRGGDVIVFSSCGPADGRWLVSDCTRSAFSQFSSLTLVPPIMPLSEAEVAGTTGKSTGTSTVNPKTGNAVGGTVAGGYAHPFPGGWSPGRLDMGYDGTFKGQIVAPFAGTITYASSSFSNWGGYVELKASGPIPGLPTDTLYFAEGISPATRSGQTVKAGQAIANAVASRWNGIVGNIEWGVAASGTAGSPTDPLAETGISDPARMVLSFSQWAQKTLGVAAPATTDHAGYP